MIAWQGPTLCDLLEIDLPEVSLPEVMYKKTLVYAE